MKMDNEHLILTRQLPKTGQTISYYNRDDGDEEAGWWRGRLNANNKTRFIPETISGDDVVIDRATGLMWAADFNEQGCNNGNDEQWTNALWPASIMTFAGYQDWRIPNVNELFTITDLTEYDPAINLTLFPNTPSVKFWSSTTYKFASTLKWYVDFSNGEIDTWNQFDQLYMRVCRGGL